MYKIRYISCIAISIAAPILLQAVTAKPLPVYQLPFYEDEYPYSITLEINNTTHEPIFVVTRTSTHKTIEALIVEPFSTATYEITIPTLRAISQTWILFSFNQETVQKLADDLYTGRNIKHIVRTKKGSAGIVYITRQKRFKPTLRTITINNTDLNEAGSWGI